MLNFFFVAYHWEDLKNSNLNFAFVELFGSALIFYWLKYLAKFT